MDEFDVTKHPNYSPPPEPSPWEEWVEIRLSRQGTILIGLGVGLAVTLGLTALNGKVVVNLVNSHKQVVETLNQLTGGRHSAVDTGSDSAAVATTASPSRVSYATPEKRVNTSAIAPADPALLAELREKMKATGAEPPSEFM